ncbi:hypothetical protein [Terrimonas pollutisoli]|uniref:hypothetical protein n=1 Tax=Terrimonas pollutisoli TaxID=3034147 RepID=UPI0023ED69A1|nr:hypothetical protein [Terrimonas sp. H1YJ31]
MRYPLVLLMTIFLIGCNQQDSKKQEDKSVGQIKDSLVTNPELKKDSAALASNDSLLLQLSKNILATIKTKDLSKMSSYVHPGLGIRFSPYAFVDTIHQQHLLPQQLTTFNQQKKVLVWGSHDGSGEPIKLSIHKYFDEFVYDADFINAPHQAVNKVLASGNSLNNLKVIYPNADFTEFYFPGFDPKYDGMDWKTLRLVFQTENNKAWLIAIIHDEWTI